MTKNKKATEESSSEVETLVVGAGPAGRQAARRLQAQHPHMQILLLESEDRVGGRAAAGLHLVDVSAAKRNNIKVGQNFLNAKVRWNREWLSPEDVDWNHKEWIAKVPQWQHVIKTPKALVKELPESDVDVAVKLSSPVRLLSLLADSSEDTWRVETSEHKYTTKKIVWAAGITAFQNAMGKNEAQSFLVENPLYVKEAADFRGGLSLELMFKERPLFESLFEADSLFVLPVKHNGKLFPLFGVFSEIKEGFGLSTMIHVHQDMLGDAKEILSFQKSILRGLKNICPWEDSNLLHEKSIVSSRIAGHVLGTPWLLGRGMASLSFVGDESLAGVEKNDFDTAAALASVDDIVSETNPSLDNESTLLSVNPL